MRLLFFLIIVFSCAGAFSQGDPTIQQLSRQIDSLNRLLAEHQAQRTELLEQREAIQLQWVRQRLKKYGLPAYTDTGQVVHHAAYSLAYSERHEQARWVAHVVTKEVEHGNAIRTNDFRADPEITTNTSEKGDYWYSGYDRGHLAASADFRWSEKALSESYYYSNIAPMRPALNRKCWAKLENFVRQWAVSFEEVFVTTGGILNDTLSTTGQHTYRVSVPKMFYKVIVDYRSTDIKGIGFVLPNDTCRQSLYQYAVTIDSIERLTGIDFFHQLPDVDEEVLEGEININKWKIEHALTSAQPMQNLEKGRLNTLEAAKHIGKRRTVCGTVVSTKYSQKTKGKPTFINLDRPFPEEVFSMTIWGNDRKNFSYAPEEALMGEEVCVTGRIDEYKGTPQMMLKHERQIEFLDR